MKLSALLSALKTTFSTGNRAPAVVYRGSSTRLASDETVLDALLRAGHRIPHSCRAGACQSCLMVADGPVAATAQRGLDPGQRALNQFLACQLRPERPLQVCDLDSSQTITAELVDKAWLNSRVIRLRLRGELDYRAGQYLSLWKDGNLGRSYSLASVPELDNCLELHIRVLENGEFSQWAARDLQPGTPLTITGPLGRCVYSAESGQPLLLAAIGTGLAPIYGILRDALRQEHSGNIDLLLGAANAEGFYLVEELRELADKHPNLRLHFLLAEGQATFAQDADIYSYAQALLPDLRDHRIYLCGAPSFVRKMQRQCFMAGASMHNISADAFIAAATS